MIEPEQFLRQAYKLIDPSSHPSETDCRSAVSRAYYSLFHETSRHLYWKYQFRRPRADAHEAVKEALLDVDLEAGLEYDGYVDDRNKADYDLGEQFDDRTASETKIKNIDRLIRKVKTL